jgi:hypothetical protein
MTCQTDQENEPAAEWKNLPHTGRNLNVIDYLDKHKMLPPRVPIGNHKSIAFQTAVSDLTAASLQFRLKITPRNSDPSAT